MRIISIVLGVIEHFDPAVLINHLHFRIRRFGSEPAESEQPTYDE
jgi:hypothetical protein